MEAAVVVDHHVIILVVLHPSSLQRQVRQDIQEERVGMAVSPVVAEELEELEGKNLVSCDKDGLGTKRWVATDAGAKLLREAL